MPHRARTIATIEIKRIGDRPAILEATRSLGLNDRQVAGLMGVSAEAVNQWVRGKKPIPPVRYLALLFLVTKVTGVLGEVHPPRSRYARRVAVARNAATAWSDLARAELHEDAAGAVFEAEIVDRGASLGAQMVARLRAI